MSFMALPAMMLEPHWPRAGQFQRSGEVKMSKRRLMYIELKSGYGDNGPAWIKFSLQEKLDSYWPSSKAARLHQLSGCEESGFCHQDRSKVPSDWGGARFLECAKQNVEDAAIEFRFGPLESDYYDG
jgi:hypothetical protein